MSPQQLCHPSDAMVHLEAALIAQNVLISVLGIQASTCQCSVQSGFGQAHRQGGTHEAEPVPQRLRVDLSVLRCTRCQLFRLRHEAGLRLRSEQLFGRMFGRSQSVNQFIGRGSSSLQFSSKQLNQNANHLSRCTC